MRSLSIDIETFSSVDLAKCGVYRYCESPDFTVLLFGYSVDGGVIQVVDLACGEAMPPDILSALTDDSVQKWAFNANFERVCLSRYLQNAGVSLDASADSRPSADALGGRRYLSPASWRCSMVWAAYMGMLLSLEGVGVALGLEKQKLTEGKELIRYFCTPRKHAPHKGQISLPGFGTDELRNLPEHAPDKWSAFKAYNMRDVEVEMAIQASLAKFPVPDSVWSEYCQDQEINDRGVMLDMELVRRAIKMDARSKDELTAAMREMTELDNPNSVAQMKQWLCDKGMETDTLDKNAVAELLKTAPEPLGKVLSLRQQLAKSSVRKYQAMESAVCSDGRARGMFQFYGASRTGRWSGRLIQMQNLPQNHLPDLEQARALVRCGDFAALELLYDSVPEVLSELIRTAFIPKLGYRFIVADFSAIEARVIAWLAGETWRNEVFATHGKIYEASASQMFRVPIEEIAKGSPLRQKGKIAELALGYGGSVGALKAMGALEMGLEEDELQPLVTAWRSANPSIVRLWWDIDRVAMTAVRDRTAAESHGIKFECQSDRLFIALPSGRRLCYVKPRIGTNRFGSPCVTYEGVSGTKKWARLDTYGPKLVENIVQAISRDILANAMQELRHLDIVMTVHDEIAIEADQHITLHAICRQMSRTPSWAEGLLLRADGYECPFYKKD
jgi:DNA polymerase